MKNELNTESRNDTVDIIKGIAAVLVVWGHSIQYFSVNGFDFWNSKVFQAIYSFHMPLFMLISGYLFYWTCMHKDLRMILTDKLRSIGIPMLTWGSIIAIALYRNNITLKIWLNQIVGIWFLWAVLISSIIVACSVKWGGAD